MTVIKLWTPPPEQQAVEAKGVRSLVFNLAARLTRHARYLVAHIKFWSLEQTFCQSARSFFRELSRFPLVNTS